MPTNCTARLVRVIKGAIEECASLCPLALDGRVEDACDLLLRSEFIEILGRLAIRVASRYEVSTTSR